MYPREHAMVSAAAVLLTAIGLGHGPATVTVWVVVGAAAGVLIDTDHVVTAAVFGGKWGAAARWVRQPFHAILEPRSFVEDIRYGGRWLYIHRMVSHLLILPVLVLFRGVHPVMTPIILGVTAHIAADIAWDLYHDNYRLRG